MTKMLITLQTNSPSSNVIRHCYFLVDNKDMIDHCVKNTNKMVVSIITNYFCYILKMLIHYGWQYAALPHLYSKIFASKCLKVQNFTVFSGLQVALEYKLLFCNIFYEAQAILTKFGRSFPEQICCSMI